jgi:hypothetical protein
MLWAIASVTTIQVLSGALRNTYQNDLHIKNEQMHITQIKVSIEGGADNKPTYKHRELC